MYGANHSEELPLKRQKIEHVASCVEDGPQFAQSGYGSMPYPTGHHTYLGQDEPLVNLPSDSLSPLTSLSNLTNKAGFFDTGKPEVKCEIQQTDCSTAVPADVLANHHQPQQQYQQLQQSHATQLQQYPSQWPSEHNNVNNLQWQFTQSNMSPYNNMHSHWGQGQGQQAANIPHSSQQEYLYRDKCEQQYHCQSNPQQYDYQQYGYPQSGMPVNAQAYPQQGNPSSVNDMFHARYNEKERETQQNSIQYMVGSVAATYGGHGANNSALCHPESQHYSYSSQSHVLQHGSAPQNTHVSGYTNRGLNPSAIKREPSQDYANMLSGYQGMQVYNMDGNPASHRLSDPYQQGYIDNTIIPAAPEPKPDPSAAMLCAWDSLDPTCGSLPEQFIALEMRLSQILQTLSFGEPVTHIYNPTDYAIEPHRHYVNTYCQTTKQVLFLGMNPGPYGMGQTGVGLTTSLTQTYRC